MSFRDRLKEARMAKGFKQIELSELIGLSKNAVSNYENGTSNPNVDVLYKIFDVLDVDPNFLFQDEVSIHKTTLNTTEKTLLTNYRTLNPEGQEKAIAYVEDLTGNSKYTISEKETGIPKNAKEILEKHLSAMKNTSQIAAQGEGVHLGTASKVTPERMEEIEKLSQQFNKE